MRKKIVFALFSLFLLYTCVPAVSAETYAIPEYAAEIPAARCGDSDWLNDYLPSKVGQSSADWYIMVASHETTPLPAYSAALQTYLATANIPSAATRERMALALVACEPAAPALCTQILDDAVEGLGIMSRIFALHLLNNGVTSTKFTSSDILFWLLEQQASDGGWSLQGNQGDPDVTAMVLQAIAPYTNESAVSVAVNQAMQYLAAAQLPNGGYQSYGVENPESTAQVIIALCALGLDPDTHLNPDGHTLTEAMLQFRVGHGQYAHTMGAAANEMATAQVYMALTALMLYENNESSLFLFHDAKPQLVQPETTASPITTVTTVTTTITQLDASPTSASISATTLTTEPQNTTTETETTISSPTSTTTTSTTTHPPATTVPTTTATSPITTGKQYPYRLPLTAGVGGIALLACIVFALRKEKSYKPYLTTGIIAAVCIGGIWLIRVETPAQYYTKPTNTGGGTVTLSIRCDSILGMDGADAYPADGILLPETSFSINPDETVLELLYDAVKTYALQVEVDGISETAYVRGIASLYEMDFGDLSGWTYTVNGIRPAVGCGGFTLSDGDIVGWEYVLTP